MNLLTDKITQTIRSFMSNCTQSKIKIYNEISLQLELGIFLRNNLKDFTLRFERNINAYSTRIGKNKINKNDFIKREIDIVLFNGVNEVDAEEIYAIELKFPRNGQYPEQMYSFIKDIKFMEEVKTKLNFTNTYCVTLVDDPNFYNPNNKTLKDIYRHFRIGDKNLHQLKSATTINKPTGPINKRTSITIENDHVIEWHKLENDCDWTEQDKKDFRYYLIEI